MFSAYASVSGSATAVRPGPARRPHCSASAARAHRQHRGHVGAGPCEFSARWHLLEQFDRLLRIVERFRPGNTQGGQPRKIPSLCTQVAARTMQLERLFTRCGGVVECLDQRALDSARFQDLSQRLRRKSFACRSARPYRAAASRCAEAAAASRAARGASSTTASTRPACSA